MHRINTDRAREIRALKRLNDDQIDTTDIPEVLDWSHAAVGRFYRPMRDARINSLPGCPTQDVPHRFMVWLTDYGEFAA